MSDYALKPVSQPSPQLSALCDDLYGRLMGLEDRKRGRSKAADQSYQVTLLAVVSPIAMIALCRKPPFNGVPIAKSDGAYSRSGLSARYVREILAGLERLGFALGRNGFFDADRPERSFPSSYRHTWEFADLVRHHSVQIGDLILPPEAVIVLNGDQSLPVPPDVSASASAVHRWNERSRHHELTFPPGAWDDLGKRVIAARSNGKGDRLHQGYSDDNRYLKRVFTDNYERGGRLYGGFWQCMPKDIRTQGFIDGEPVIELDYEAIHPTIIAANMRQPLGVDPYSVPGYAYDRQAGKKMFFRILNAKGPVKFDARFDKKVFRTSEAFNEFRDAMRKHLSVISAMFECDYGVRLQKQDSALALNVLLRFLDSGIIAYPVHDSFIVKSSHRDEVKSIMHEEFQIMFSWNIKVK